MNIRMSNPFRNMRAFTLIELLVVISIIALLSSVVLASINSAREKARDAKRLTEMNQMQTALAAIYSETGSYPPTSGWNCSFQSDWQTSSFAVAMDKYMPTLPTDPTNNAVFSYANGLSYCYFSSGYGGAGKWYMLVFRLERPNIELDQQDGSMACDNTFFNYGGDEGHMITYGGSCVK